MANNIKAQAAGGSIQNLDGMTTVGDVKKRLGLTAYTAVVNGDPKPDSYVLSDYEFVALSENIKGGSVR